MTIKQLGGVFGRNPTFNNVTIEGTLTFDGDIDINSDLTISGNLYLPDNRKAIFGDGSDLQIYHDGSNSYITDAGAGALIIDGSSSTQIKGSSFVILRSSAGENMAVGNADGAFDLYYNGSKKLATTATGIDVTGTATMDGLDVNSTTSGAANIQVGNFAADIALGIGSPSTANKVVVTAGGSVGIGTSSPNNKMSITGFDEMTLGFPAVSGGASRSGIKPTVTGAGAGQIQFLVGGDNNNEATTVGMMLDASGNVLVGKSSTANAQTTVGHLLLSDGRHYATASGGVSGIFSRTTSDGDIVSFYKDGAAVGSVSTISSDLCIGSSITRVRFDDNGAITPRDGSDANSDATIDLGQSSGRFKDLYRSGSTISTSDRNMKQDERDLTEAEATVAQACKSLLRAFRFIDAVEKDGDGARIHFGIVAQDLQAAFEAEGLDATNYAMFRPSTYADENGNEQTRLGVCYENLLAFIIAAI